MKAERLFQPFELTRAIRSEGDPQGQGGLASAEIGYLVPRRSHGNKRAIKKFSFTKRRYPEIGSSLIDAGGSIYSGMLGASASKRQAEFLK